MGPGLRGFVTQICRLRPELRFPTQPVCELGLFYFDLSRLGFLGLRKLQGQQSVLETSYNLVPIDILGEIETAAERGVTALAHHVLRFLFLLLEGFVRERKPVPEG